MVEPDLIHAVAGAIAPVLLQPTNRKLLAICIAHDRWCKAWDFPKKSMQGCSLAKKTLVECWMLIVIIGALTIGLSLGLLGSGGSAITVPVLVYVDVDVF